MIIFLRLIYNNNYEIYIISPLFIYNHMENADYIYDDKINVKIDVAIAHKHTDTYI